MKPAFAEASSKLAQKDITLAKVDATSVTDVADEQQVSSYPTMVIFRDCSRVEKYGGGRSAAEIVEYMTKIFDQSSSDDDSEEDQCLNVSYSASNYASCCASGNWKKGT